PRAPVHPRGACSAVAGWSGPAATALRGLPPVAASLHAAAGPFRRRAAAPPAHAVAQAEREGIEPPLPSRVKRFPRPPHSTALPPLRSGAKVGFAGNVGLGASTSPDQTPPSLREGAGPRAWTIPPVRAVVGAGHRIISRPSQLVGVTEPWAAPSIRWPTPRRIVGRGGAGNRLADQGGHARRADGSWRAGCAVRAYRVVWHSPEAVSL